MNREELIALLQRHRYGVVSSVADDGSPQGAVVGIAVDAADGSIVFDTLGSARKARNLRRDARVALTVWEGETTVQLEGRADEPTGAERERALATYLAVFPDGAERLKWEGITHFRIRPAWARFSDFDAKPEPRIVELKL